MTTLIAEINVSTQGIDEAASQFDALLAKGQQVEDMGGQISSSFANVGQALDLSSIQSALDNVAGQLTSLGASAQGTSTSLGDLNAAAELSGESVLNLGQSSDSASSQVTNLGSAAQSGAENLQQHGTASREAAGGLGELQGSILETVGGMLGLEGAVSSTSGILGSMSTEEGLAAGEFAPMAAGAAAAGAAILLAGESFSTFTEEASSMFNLSAAFDTTGASVEALKATFEDAGKSGDSVNTVFQRLTTGLAQVQTQMDAGKDVTGKFADGMNALGISMTNTDGSLKTSGELMPEIMAKFQQLGEEGGKTASGISAATIANDLFGRSGAQNVAVFEQLNGTYADNLANIVSLGIGTDAQIAKWQEWQHASTEMHDALLAIELDVGEGLAPGMTTLADVVGTVASAFQHLEQAATGSTPGAQALSFALNDIKDVVLSSIPGYTQLSELVQIVGRVHGDASTEVSKLSSIQQDAADAAALESGAIGGLTNVLGPFIEKTQTAASAAAQLTGALGGIVAVNNPLNNALSIYNKGLEDSKRAYDLETQAQQADVQGKSDVAAALRAEAAAYTAHNTDLEQSTTRNVSLAETEASVVKSTAKSEATDVTTAAADRRQASELIAQGKTDEAAGYTQAAALESAGDKQGALDAIAAGKTRQDADDAAAKSAKTAATDTNTANELASEGKQASAEGYYQAAQLEIQGDHDSAQAAIDAGKAKQSEFDAEVKAGQQAAKDQVAAGQEYFTSIKSMLLDLPNSWHSSLAATQGDVQQHYQALISLEQSYASGTSGLNQGMYNAQHDELTNELNDSKQTYTQEAAAAASLSQARQESDKAATEQAAANRAADLSGTIAANQQKLASTLNTISQARQAQMASSATDSQVAQITAGMYETEAAQATDSATRQKDSIQAGLTLQVASIKQAESDKIAAIQQSEETQLTNLNTQLLAAQEAVQEAKANELQIQADTDTAKANIDIALAGIQVDLATQVTSAQVNASTTTANAAIASADVQVNASTVAANASVTANHIQVAGTQEVGVAAIASADVQVNALTAVATASVAANHIQVAGTQEVGAATTQTANIISTSLPSAFGAATSASTTFASTTVAGYEAVIQANQAYLQQLTGPYEQANLAAENAASQRVTSIEGSITSLQTSATNSIASVSQNAANALAVLQARAQAALGTIQAVGAAAASVASGGSGIGSGVSSSYSALGLGQGAAGAGFGNGEDPNSAFPALGSLSAGGSTSSSGSSGSTSSAGSTSIPDIGNAGGGSSGGGGGTFSGDWTSVRDTRGNSSETLSQIINQIARVGGPQGLQGVPASLAYTQGESEAQFLINYGFPQGAVDAALGIASGASGGSTGGVNSLTGLAQTSQGGGGSFLTIDPSNTSFGAYGPGYPGYNGSEADYYGNIAGTPSSAYYPVNGQYGAYYQGSDPALAGYPADTGQYNGSKPIPITASAPIHVIVDNQLSASGLSGIAANGQYQQQTLNQASSVPGGF